MKRAKTCLISVAMIARNEAARLERAVASAQQFADEVIVADTGSDDGTPELAVKLGCRLVRHPWSHNFAAARNASVAACRGAYVFWMDPDETIPPEDAPELRRLALEGTHDEIRCPTWINATYRPAEQDLPGFGPGFVVLKPRMFRRSVHVRWRFRVHEDLCWSRAVSRCDSFVRVLNFGDANKHGTGGEDYYHALMVIGLREDPGQPHYALYLSEYALVGSHDTERAQAYLDACDPKRLGGEEQVEKYWLLVGRTHKARALMAAESGDQDGAKAAAVLALEAYGKAHAVLGRSRAPLEAATLLLYGGQRERFDAMVREVLKADPGNLQAIYLERLSALEADTATLNVNVGTWLMAQQGRDPESAFAAIVGAGGKLEMPLRVRVVVPARISEDTPLRVRNLGVCLGRLKAARTGLPDGVTVEVVLVEQEGGLGLVEFAAQADAEYAFMDDPGPFNRAACLNAGANWIPYEDDEDTPDGHPVPDYAGPDLLCLLDGDLWVGDDWLRLCLDFIAGWKKAGVWRGAMLPYGHAYYLNEEVSAKVSTGTAPPPSACSERVVGERYMSVGGALWIEPELYARVGGFDEGYRGWGCEDDDLHARLLALMGAPLLRVPGPLWHLHHEEADHSTFEVNRRRFVATADRLGIAV